MVLEGYFPVTQLIASLWVEAVSTVVQVKPNKCYNTVLTTELKLDSLSTRAYYSQQWHPLLQL